MASNVLGIVRKVDELGRVVIPKEYRKELGIKEGSKMEIIYKDGALQLIPYEEVK